jgi:hypothetical protein
LCESRIEIRGYFDYHEPERYLMHVFTLWKAYHAYALRYPVIEERAEKFVPIRVELEDQEAWRDLFDGMDPQEFLGEQELH